ncbi:MAG: hypothetical protein RJA34_2727 [Pseudomonadota bacterium]|jgi:hypothetical protein
MVMNTQSVSTSNAAQRTAPAPRAEAVKTSETAQLARTASEKQAPESAPSKPVINAQGQTTGRLLNVKA